VAVPRPAPPRRKITKSGWSTKPTQRALIRTYKGQPQDQDEKSSVV